MGKLEVRGIRSYYGSIQALKGMSLTVEDDEIVPLIGANGAGKSTALNTISGLITPCEGEMLLDGEVISELPAHEAVKRGISQAPKGRRICACGRTWQ